MANEKDINRNFAPSTVEAPSRASKEAVSSTKRSPSRGMPKVRVNPKIAMEFENELVEKLSSGRKRMFWFANHFILFVIGVAVAIALKLSIFAKLENEFFLVGLGAWVGILAIHARYALAPIFRRSEKESQLKAIIPDASGSKTGKPDNRDQRRGR